MSNKLVGNGNQSPEQEPKVVTMQQAVPERFGEAVGYLSVLVGSNGQIVVGFKEGTTPHQMAVMYEQVGRVVMGQVKKALQSGEGGQDAPRIVIPELRFKPPRA